MSKQRREMEHNLNEDLPVDVYPCSNGEFAPEKPTAEQHAIMELQNAEIERQRQRFNMSRRQFVRTAGAMSIGVWAVSQITGGRWGSYAGAVQKDDACDLNWEGAQLNNMPGEFIFDVQSHHIESGGEWRATNPGFHAFFTAIWSQSGPLGGTPFGNVLGGEFGSPVGSDGKVRGWGYGEELDPMENLSRYHYLKELYLDSSTNMCVLSAVPSAPEDQPLSIEEAAKTIDVVNGLAQNTPRAVMHAFVMPNRGSLGTTSESMGTDPVFMAEEFELMEQHINNHPGMICGWKTYPAWGDVPYSSGWYFDDNVGEKFFQRVIELGDRYDMPKTIAVHKGFALPMFDQRAASPRDIGPSARSFPDVNIVVYHSGYDMETQRAYPGDDQVNSADRGVDCLVKSLRENRWDASQFILPGLDHGNVPNVWAEIGSTWRSIMRNADQSAHLLGKLITHVGPQRVVWGTDSLWFGSPQSEIVHLRAFEFSNEAKELYNLPHGLEGDRFDPRVDCNDPFSYTPAQAAARPAIPDWPTDGRPHPERSIRNGIFGRNAAVPYRVDPDAARAAISCDEVQKIRDGYILNSGINDPRNGAPYASNRLVGKRTEREVIHEIMTTPWSP
jgi:uncharacterized protein